MLPVPYIYIFFSTTFFAECCRQFHDIAVRRGKDVVKTTVTAEVNKQVEIYVSNSVSRVRRAAKKRRSTDV